MTNLTTRWLTIAIATATTLTAAVTLAADTDKLDKNPEQDASFSISARLPDASAAAANGWKKMKHGARLVASPSSPEELNPEVAGTKPEGSFGKADNGKRITAMLVYEDGTSYARTGEIDLGYLVPPADFGAYNPDFKSAPEGTTNEDDQMGTESIVGGSLNSDRRVRYSSTSLLGSYPYRTVGSISSNGNTKQGWCSGVMIGPRHVLTAAHCVHDSNGNWFSPIYFNPGQTNASKVNGSHKMVARWARDHGINKKYDYAVIVLQDSPQLASLGWMGIAWWNSSASYSGKFAYNKGYPGPTRLCKASPLASKQCDGWMYGDSEGLNSLSAFFGDLLQYNIDTDKGQSGSPVYTYLNGSPAVIAVHAYGVSDGLLNHGAKFRASMYNDVCSWIGVIDSAYAAHPNCN